jgi:dTMP kinase
MTRSLLVAIFGNDGAGKSTLVQSVRDEFAGRSISCAVMDKWDILDRQLHPNLDFIVPELDPLRVAIARMEPLSRMLFLFWTMATTVRAIDDPEVVLLDGYWYKHAAAELALGADSELVRSITSALPKPDLVVYLDIDPLTAARRKHGLFTPYECGCIEPCSEDNFLSHQEAVRAELEETSGLVGAVRIDASQPPYAVLGQAMTLIMGRLQPDRVEEVPQETGSNGEIHGNHARFG